MLIGLIIIGLFILFFCMIYSVYSEFTLWNGGKCECGGHWKLVGKDKFGGRSYDCDQCGKKIYIGGIADMDYDEEK